MNSLIKEPKESHKEQLSSFLAHIVQGARTELYLTPKPGLVDLLDSGSHEDLNLVNMSRSICLLEEYRAELVSAKSLDDMVQAGIRAEERMMSLLGTNTHKGFIFLMGLLTDAYSRCSGIPSLCELSERCAEASASLFKDEREPGSCGAAVRKEAGIGGIRGECLNGLPTVLDKALPVMFSVYEETDNYPLAAFHCLAKLMSVTEDSTAVKRCGIEGLTTLRNSGFRLGALLERGDVPFNELIDMNEKFKAINLTMGGTADLFGITAGLFSSLHRRIIKF
ncbi:triphosphoribosyl-dephospho-CoA synthase [Limisalsivibrio acetivorans]|uniref:triphosphoribosyl-dephospho-CoA synthase n=1 Tax=Limisalsivibrio acetivorans TaxID=1304888 RepID=UPI0003B6D05A|nr:triphosphoribosyl-dephospho-CoA synthase [Limisalsivibrio acetivorans]